MGELNPQGRGLTGRGNRAGKKCQGCNGGRGRDLVDPGWGIGIVTAGDMGKGLNCPQGKGKRGKKVDIPTKGRVRRSMVVRPRWGKRRVPDYICKCLDEADTICCRQTHGQIVPHKNNLAS